MDLLVTYDIATDTPAGERRLRQVAAVCEAYGVRVQKSVFECRLDAPRLTQLILDLRDQIDPRTDSVNIYRFAGSVRAARLEVGRPPSARGDGGWIV